MNCYNPVQMQYIFCMGLEKIVKRRSRLACYQVAAFWNPGQSNRLRDPEASPYDYELLGCLKFLAHQRLGTVTDFRIV